MDHNTNPVLASTLFNVAMLRDMPEAELAMVGYKGNVYLKNVIGDSFLAADDGEGARAFGSEDQLVDFFYKLRKFENIKISFYRLPLTVLLVRRHATNLQFVGQDMKLAA